MSVDKVKIVSKGKGYYSSSVSAIEIKLQNKSMSAKELFFNVMSNKKVCNRCKKLEKI